MSTNDKHSTFDQIISTNKQTQQELKRLGLKNIVISSDGSIRQISTENLFWLGGTNRLLIDADGNRQLTFSIGNPLQLHPKDFLLVDAVGNLLQIAADGTFTLLEENGKFQMVTPDGTRLKLGSTGDDMLDGVAGKDIYLLSRNSGHDRIIAISNQANDEDIVQLDEGITPEEVQQTRQGFDLIIKIANSSSSMTVKNHYVKGVTTIAHLKTAAG